MVLIFKIKIRFHMLESKLMILKVKILKSYYYKLMTSVW